MTSEDNELEDLQKKLRQLERRAENRKKGIPVDDDDEEEGEYERAAVRRIKYTAPPSEHPNEEKRRGWPKPPVPTPVAPADNTGRPTPKPPADLQPQPPSKQPPAPADPGCPPRGERLKAPDAKAKPPQGESPGVNSALLPPHRSLSPNSLGARAESWEEEEEEPRSGDVSPVQPAAAVPHDDPPPPPGGPQPAESDADGGAGQQLELSTLQAYAEMIGLNPAVTPSDAHLMWIAEEGMAAPLSPEWCVNATEAGDVYYIHLPTRETTWQHPSTTHYTAVVVKHKARLHAVIEEFSYLENEGWSLPLPKTSITLDAKAFMNAELYLHKSWAVDEREHPGEPVPIGLEQFPMDMIRSLECCTVSPAEPGIINLIRQQDGPGSVVSHWIEVSDDASVMILREHMQAFSDIPQIDY
ncbi:hypothetical protein DIPPA_24406 [Diplonema papillatum]|nr:hypothetical protein DIPPA_24406 [Diplonema papillatum]